MLVKLCFHRWYASTVDIRECRRHQKRVFLTWLLEYKFSKEVLLLSVICRRGCAKFIGMATFSVFAGVLALGCVMSAANVVWLVDIVFIFR